MKRVYLIAAIIAIICGLIIFSVFTKQKKEQERKQAEIEAIAAERAQTVTQIVTASRDIVKGETFTSDMLSTIEVDKAVLISLDALTDANMVIGRQAARNITSGEAITNNALRSLTGSSSGIVSMNIPKGLSAIQLEANVDNAVGEHIEEGDYIDILIGIEQEQPKTQNDKEQQQPAKKQWQVLCQHLLVVKLGDRFYKTVTEDGQPTNQYYNYVIVAVEPQTAISILNAKNNGEIKMLLNSSKDE